MKLYRFLFVLLGLHMLPAHAESYLCTSQSSTALMRDRTANTLEVYQPPQAGLRFVQAREDGIWKVRPLGQAKWWLQCDNQYFCNSSPKNSFDGHFVRKKDNSFDVFRISYSGQRTSSVLAGGRCIAQEHQGSES